MDSAEKLPKMEYRRLGRSGLFVSVISLGGWVTYGGSVGDQLAFDCMKAAYDAGISFFDCAEGYAEGKSETVMGQAIKKFEWKRNDFVISTKIYWGGAYGDNPVNNYGLSRKHLIEGTEAALKRLQLDYVDLLYCHRPDRQTPTEETNPEEIAMAWACAEKLNMIGPLMEQPQYNLLVRDKVERQFASLYRDYGLGLTIFSPLKMGILSGKYNDGIPNDSRIATGSDPFTQVQKVSYGNDAWQKDIEQTRKLKPIADKLGADIATLALAWVIKNPNVSSAITGASKVEQVTKSVKSLDLLSNLTDEVMKKIDETLDNKPEGLTMRFI